MNISNSFNEVFFLIPNWKWLALLGGILAGGLAIVVSRPAFTWVKNRYANKPALPLFLRAFLGKNIQLALSWLLAAGIWHLTLAGLNLHEGFTHFMVLVLQLLAVVNFMRLLYLAVDALGMTLAESLSSRESTIDGQLAPFATKVLKFVVITFAVLMSLQSLGFNVGALLAGLGIGSLAFALAAQDTVANLFGSITIIFDRPFKRGDYIKVGDTEGTVEDIGFRSTRVRTGAQSLITVPNSAMAKERIENLGVRPSRLFHHIVGISCSTEPRVVEHFVQQLREMINRHPKVVPGSAVVQLKSLGDWDLKILVDAYLNVRDAGSELETQQELLLGLLRLSQDLGVQLPYPTKTVELIDANKVL